ncbi:cupin domain-containing protein [Psychroserpens sp. AS72]|uniref:cupin domain-containing protein n=1 Tax=Psychroserpens sp. AS72 TaxID=3135775 RepID=UPI00316B0AD8
MNINDQLKTIKDYYSPKIIGEVNDVYIKLVKIKGDKVPRHNHKDEDESFYVLNKGKLLFEIENKEPFTMKKGDMFIVKKGINHKVSSKKECHLMLIENKSALHTGNVIHEITKSIKNQMD